MSHVTVKFDHAKHISAPVNCETPKADISFRFPQLDNRMRDFALCRYVHRVGRTGRAGQSGVALTLFTPQDADLQTQLNSNLSKRFVS